MALVPDVLGRLNEKEVGLGALFDVVASLGKAKLKVEEDVGFASEA